MMIPQEAGQNSNASFRMRNSTRGPSFANATGSMPISKLSLYVQYGSRLCRVEQQHIRYIWIADGRYSSTFNREGCHLPE